MWESEDAQHSGESVVKEPIGQPAAGTGKGLWGLW